MADVPADAPDGEPKISKRAAEKAAKKAQAKAAKEAAKANASTDLATRPKDAPTAGKPIAKPTDTGPNLDEDPMDAAIQVGWLKDVYQIAPVGKGVTTRFPPEPNGFLHVGHAKAIAVNFGFAKYHGGHCYLRYDDTNPEKEEGEYFDSIKEMVEWLGYTPYKVTYSSDHFAELYELAEELIRRGKAYTCYCTQEEMQMQKGGPDNRGARYACSHREKPMEESLEEFRGMRDGKFKPKEVFLRMKMNLLDSGNPYMWDMAAYRITEHNHHHRTGDKWRIYPTYDFTHCLCDAFEQITHSLCTTEFRTARESYDWLLDQLESKLPFAKPQQREYGRLNVTGTVLSKRKIQKLVAEKHVRGWDDPRLYTLIALRRRGIPPGAIRTFVAELGVSDNTTIIQTIRLETTVRKYLEKTVPRLMLIPDPIPVHIDNLADDYCEEISLDFMPRDASMGSHVVPFTNTIYIDRVDFRAVDDANFFRLAPGKKVGLLSVPHPIECTSFTTDAATGKVTGIRATYCNSDTSSTEKPKAFIQWVAKSAHHNSPVAAEVRIFHPLFRSANPDAHPSGNFLEDINPQSEEVYPDALLEAGFEEVRSRKPWPRAGEGVESMHGGVWDVRFQGMRVAYFAVDQESTGEKVVLNQIVSLKEDAGK